MIAFLFCWGEHRELRAGQKQFSFYIAEERKEGAKASFYIEEKKEEEAKTKKRWNVALGSLIYGPVNPGEVNNFIAGINNWYLTQLFKGVEWAGPPPYLDLDLAEIRNVSGYQGRIVYMFNPGFGIGIEYDDEKSTTGKSFSYYKADDTQERWLNGGISMEVSLSGPSLLLLLQRSGFAGTLDTSFYLGAGTYTGKINWEVLESWEAVGMEPKYWKNNWIVSGWGNTIGYKAGANLSCPFGNNLFMFLDVEYRSIMIGNLNYKQTEYKEFPGELWINDLKKPFNLDFSGIIGKFGLGLNF